MRLGCVKVAVSLGSNLGDRYKNLIKGMESLRALPWARNFQFSSIYETGAMDCQEPMAFLNAVTTFQTKQSAEELLDQLLTIETGLGRERPYPNAPRRLDLDLLLYGQEVSEKPQLNVPHPRMQHRLFVLTPLAELDGSRQHPTLGKTIYQLEDERRSLGRKEDVINKSQLNWPMNT